MDNAAQRLRRLGQVRLRVTPANPFHPGQRQTADPAKRSGHIAGHVTLFRARSQRLSQLAVPDKGRGVPAVGGRAQELRSELSKLD